MILKNAIKELIILEDLMPSLNNFKLISKYIKILISIKKGRPIRCISHNYERKIWIKCLDKEKIHTNIQTYWNCFGGSYVKSTDSCCNRFNYSKPSWLILRAKHQLRRKFRFSLVRRVNLYII